MKATNFVALEASMGNWQYYICRLRFSEAVEYLHFAEEVHPFDDLDFLLQREIASRSDAIVNFLERNDERFFGSLIVAVYGGDPKFSKIEIEGSALLGSRLATVGILHFDGKEKYYVLDGQHRLAAMRKAYKSNPERYEEDDISVIMISHSSDEEGLQRARRLFTNVNRYTVKTNKATNIALDEDDPVAILTRRLVREEEYFRKVTKIAQTDRRGQRKLVTGEALNPSADASYLLTLPTLYECNRALLAGDPLLDTMQQERPGPNEIESGWRTLRNRWFGLLERLSELQYGSETIEFAREKETGGCYFLRPIGMKALCLASGRAFEEELSADDIAQAVRRELSLNKNPWRGLIWNPEDKTMMVSKKRMTIVAMVLELWMGLRDDQEHIEEIVRSESAGVAVLR